MSKAAAAREVAPEYVWAFPGAPVRIHLPMPTVAELRDYLVVGRNAAVARGAESGGLLLGKVGPGKIEITGIRLLKPDREHGRFLSSDSDRESLRDELARHDNEVVGYFRTGLGTGIRLCDEDMLIVNSLFSDPKYVFLVMGFEEDGAPTAGFFFWDGGHIFRDATFMQFPLDEPSLATRPSTDVVIPPIASVPVPARIANEGEGIRSRRRKFWYLVAFLIVGITAAGPFIGMYVVSSREGKEQIVANLPIRVQAAPIPPAENTSSMSLWASTVRNTVAITWNSQAPVVSEARIAMLAIKDGQTQRELPLTRAQLEIGKLLYTPKTDQLEITIEVYRATGKPTRESIMVAVTRTRTPGSAPPSVETTPMEGGESSAKVAPMFTEPQQAAGMSGPDSIPEPPTLPIAIASGFSSEQMKAPEIIAQSYPQLASQVGGESLPAGRQVPQVQQPQVRRKVQPTVSPSLVAMLKRRVDLQVRVQVDANGRVTAAEPVGPLTGMGDFLARSAVNAARNWTFEPARRGTVALPSEVVLKFSFGPNHLQP